MTVVQQIRNFGGYIILKVKQVLSFIEQPTDKIVDFIINQ